jgi:hypothetical protein
MFSRLMWSKISRTLIDNMLKIETPRNNSQSQSFSQSYGSKLPTSLTYFDQKLETSNLGDLLRISVRFVMDEMISLENSKIFNDRKESTDAAKSATFLGGGRYSQVHLIPIVSPT